MNETTRGRLPAFPTRIDAGHPTSVPPRRAGDYCIRHQMNQCNPAWASNAALASRTYQTTTHSTPKPNDASARRRTPQRGPATVPIGLAAPPPEPSPGLKDCPSGLGSFVHRVRAVPGGATGRVSVAGVVTTAGAGRSENVMVTVWPSFESQSRLGSGGASPRVAPVRASRNPPSTKDLKVAPAPRRGGQRPVSGVRTAASSR